MYERCSTFYETLFKWLKEFFVYKWLGYLYVVAFIDIYSFRKSVLSRYLCACADSAEVFITGAQIMVLKDIDASTLTFKSKKYWKYKFYKMSVPRSMIECGKTVILIIIFDFI